jgi:hypothetical protein
LPQFILPPAPNNYATKKTFISFDKLFKNPPPALPNPVYTEFDDWIVETRKDDSTGSQLKELQDQLFAQFSNGHEKRYMDDLAKSYRALQIDSSQKLCQPPEYASILEVYLTEARRHVANVYKIICESLCKDIHQIVAKAKLLPRLSHVSLLSHLASDKVDNLPWDWKKIFVEYGLAITRLQRAERLFAAADNLPELFNELQNPGHRGWDPLDRPEWLLVEIENNILIREDQAGIAQEMMYPVDSMNAVMQLFVSPLPLSSDKYVN